MDTLLRIADIIDAINNHVGKVVSWVVLALVLVVFGDVVFRYVFNVSFVFTQELEWHLFAFVFLIGAGYTLITDNHVRVDIIYQRLSPKGRAWVNLLGCIFFLFPGCLLVIFTSIPFAYDSFQMLEGSPDPGGIPYRFVLKSCIPVGFILFGLQGLALFLRSLLTVLGHETPSESKEVY
jgi:TRAP-type mannitol/chloroaromatic compound transport system permease small subunit